MIDSGNNQFVTHYYRGDRRPFLNLSDVPAAAVDDVLKELAALNGSRRRFGPRYLDLRRQTEAKARQLFVSAGGHPVRRHPHYFVLGESPWFAGLYDDAREVRLSLSDLPPDATSFTYVDSITALGLGRHLGVPCPSETWKQRIYRLDQLDSQRLAEPEQHRFDGPADYRGHQFELVDFYVEIQLWIDDPIRVHLDMATNARSECHTPGLPFQP